MNDIVESEGAPGLHAQGPASLLVERVSVDEARALVRYFDELLVLRERDLPVATKMRMAVIAARRHKVASRMAASLLRNVKAIVWDSTSLPLKLGLGGVVISVATFGGGAGAGIAAGGTAISVPLWVLFGGGATALGAVVEELRRKVQSVSNSDE